MAIRSPFRARTVLIMPMVLLVVALLEDVITYKVRQYVRDVHERAAITLLLTGVGFAIAADLVAPWLQRLLAGARKTSKSSAGDFGLWVFYGAGYGALYYAYLVIERQGAGGLLPATLR